LKIAYSMFRLDFSHHHVDSASYKEGHSLETSKVLLDEGSSRRKVFSTIFHTIRKLGNSMLTYNRPHYLCFVLVYARNDRFIALEQPIPMFSFNHCIITIDHQDWVIKQTQCYWLVGRKNNTHLTMNRWFVFYKPRQKSGLLCLHRVS
jgi:hypothetical protein